MKKRRWLKVTLIVLAIGAVAALWIMYRAPLVTAGDEVGASLLIRNVRVIDVVAGTASEARDVIIEGDAIAAIEPHDPKRAAAVVIDGSGLSLIPGLIDIHAHLDGSSGPPWHLALPDIDLNLEQMLFCGITRTLDPGSRTPHIFELRDEVNAGERLGPQLLAAGPIFTAPGGHPGPLIRNFAPSFLADNLVAQMSRAISNAAEARQSVDEIAAYKPDFIKIAIDKIPLDAPRLEPAVAKSIVQAATAHKLRVLAHIGTTEDAIDAANAGVAAWIHGVYKEPISDADIDKLAAFGIPMAPTMIVFRSYSYAGRGEYPATPLEKQIAGQDALDARVAAPDDFSWGKLQSFAELLVTHRQTAIDNVRRLHAAGVTILAGSDAQGGNIHGAALHNELALLSKAGLSPLAVLRSATLNNARFLEQRDDPGYGVVAKGKRADLVLIEGDPLADSAAIGNIRHVIAGGLRIERHPLSQ